MIENIQLQSRQQHRREQGHHAPRPAVLVLLASLPPVAAEDADRPEHRGRRADRREARALDHHVQRGPRVLGVGHEAVLLLVGGEGAELPLVRQAPLEAGGAQ